MNEKPARKNVTSVIIIIACLVVIVIAIPASIFIGLQVYNYYHPELTLGVAKAKDVDFEDEQLVISFRQTSLFGMSEETYQRMNDVSKKAGDFRNYVGQTYTKPLHIDCNIEIRNGWTYITYSGTAARRDNGRVEDINEEFVFEYVLTEDIRN